MQREGSGEKGIIQNRTQEKAFLIRGQTKQARLGAGLCGCDDVTPILSFLAHPGSAMQRLLHHTRPAG